MEDGVGEDAIQQVLKKVPSGSPRQVDFYAGQAAVKSSLAQRTSVQ